MSFEFAVTPRHVARILALVVGVTFSAIAQRAHADSEAAPAGDLPVVTVAYSSLLDEACALQTGRPLDSTFVAAVRGRIAAYNAQWAARGPVLLRAAREVVRQPFQFHETRAAMVTCGLPSMSFPLVLNAHSFWRANPDSAAGGYTVFVNTLFHEVLHRYVSERLQQLPGRTTLLTKYAGESPVVRNHLHLFAIEQLVYERLQLTRELSLSVAMSKRLRSAQPFARAREIVSKEGAEAFVQELRSGEGGPR